MFPQDPELPHAQAVICVLSIGTSGAAVEERNMPEGDPEVNGIIPRTSCVIS